MQQQDPVLIFDVEGTLPFKSQVSALHTFTPSQKAHFSPRPHRPPHSSSSLTPEPNYLPFLTTPTADDPAQDQLVNDWVSRPKGRAGRNRITLVNGSASGITLR